MNRVDKAIAESSAAVDRVTTRHYKLDPDESDIGSLTVDERCAACGEVKCLCGWAPAWLCWVIKILGRSSLAKRSAQ